MVTTVNKKLVLALMLGAFIVGYILHVNGVDSFKRPVGSKIASSVTDVVGTSNKSSVNPAVEMITVPTVNFDQLRSKLKTFNSKELKVRKNAIQKEMAESKLVEKFNRHELSSTEVLKLRALALESSLITIRLFELN